MEFYEPLIKNLLFNPIFAIRNMINALIIFSVANLHHIDETEVRIRIVRRRLVRFQGLLHRLWHFFKQLVWRCNIWDAFLTMKPYLESTLGKTQILSLWRSIIFWRVFRAKTCARKSMAQSNCRSCSWWISQISADCCHVWPSRFSEQDDWSGLLI